MIDACSLLTPIGPLSLLAADGAVIGAGFTDLETLWADLHDTRWGPQPQLRFRTELGTISGLLIAYLDGQLDALDQIPTDQPGTALQQQVWAGLRAIPAGETRTYTELAATTANPAAVRAAGTACGRNRVAPIVPCHRAVRRDGSLAGYYYGLHVKRWLLAHEARSAGDLD